MIKLCHYTDDERAEKIIRSGRIMASLQTSGDAVFGNGVYLTKLNPESSTRAQVAENNWNSTSEHSLKKTKNVFVFEILVDEVKNVSTKTRNIFLLGGRKDLLLVKYKWYLQDFETGKIIASHKYHIGSTGPAATLCLPASLKRTPMGDYVMTEDTVNGRPMYQQSGSNGFLFMSSFGEWVVGRNTGKDGGFLKQKDKKYSLGPGADGKWYYGVYDADDKSCGWKGDDATLKAYPSYMSSQWKTDFHSDSSVDSGSTKPAGTPPTSPATKDIMAASTPATADATTTSTTSSTLATTPPSATNATIPPSATNATIPPSATNATAPPSATTATTPPPSILSKSSPISSNKSSPTSSNKSSPTSSNKSSPTSSKMPDPDRIDNVLQSPGTSRTGSVHGGPAGKRIGLRRRFVSMFQRLGKKQKGK